MEKYKKRFLEGFIAAWCCILLLLGLWAAAVVLSGDGSGTDAQKTFVITLGEAGSLAGRYVWEKEGFGGNFAVELMGDGSFSYSEGALSSYLGFGSWERNGEDVALTCNDGTVQRFMVGDGCLIWQEEGSDGFVYADVTDGDTFVKE